MKKRVSYLILIVIMAFLCGCSYQGTESQVVATTGPVYQFTQVLCHNTGITVTQLITEEVSCLHDYTLQVSQMRAAESAEAVILSGAGLEDFMEDVLTDIKTVIDCSNGVNVMSYGEDHDHEHEHSHDHDHEHDPHIWLSPENAKIMSRNICNGLANRYPAYADTLQANLNKLLAELDALQAYGEETLSDLSCRELVTFHDGFGYFAQAFDLHILEAIEEESGSEASARELKEMVGLVQEHDLPSLFTEISGSASAADIIAAETGIQVFTLDMAMAGDDYFEAMYHNIDTVWEAMK